VEEKGAIEANESRLQNVNAKLEEQSERQGATIQKLQKELMESRRETLDGQKVNQVGDVEC
jgi:hypothetical protein